MYTAVRTIHTTKNTPPTSMHLEQCCFRLRTASVLCHECQVRCWHHTWDTRRCLPIRYRPTLLLTKWIIAATLAILLCCKVASASSNPLELNGGSCVAMTGRGCVALAVDRRFGLGGQLVSTDAKRVLKVRSHDTYLRACFRVMLPTEDTIRSVWLREDDMFCFQLGQWRLLNTLFSTLSCPD